LEKSRCIGHSPQDRIALGLIASVPVLMVVGIYLIRSEVEQGARDAS
jgi:hypothetical protein